MGEKKGKKEEEEGRRSVIERGWMGDKNEKEEEEKSRRGSVKERGR